MQNKRRERFIAYFDRVLKGSRAALMQKTDLTKGRVAQLFDERQPFGELAARNLAQRLGLPADYLESDPAHWEGHAGVAHHMSHPNVDEMLTPQEVELIGIFRQLGAPARRVTLDALRSTQDTQEHEAEALKERLVAKPTAKPRGRSIFGELDDALLVDKKAARRRARRARCT